jgi:NhaP-type Na+/H+ or K+/H+ antiporter
MTYLPFSEVCSLLLWHVAAPFLLGYATGCLLGRLLAWRRHLPCDEEDAQE